MSFLGSVLGLFTGGSKANEADSIVKDLGDAGDKLFTSDEERKEWQEKIEKLYAYNKSSFVAGGRSAIMYCVAVVLLYDAVIRDFIGICIGQDHLPPATVDIGKLLGRVFGLLTGLS